MLLNTDHMRKLAGVMRVNPPIREPRHNQPLWDALVEGVLDMIATDHAPHTPEEKTRESIWECDCGFPGVETHPNFGDFLYFSATIGAAFATSDVSVTQSTLRRLVLAHTVLSFLFNTLILGLSVNVGASLL